MNRHKAFIIFAEDGRRVPVVAPLEFDSLNQPFSVYEKGEVRIPLNPDFLEKLKTPINGTEYYYKRDVPAPKSEKKCFDSDPQQLAAMRS